MVNTKLIAQFRRIQILVPVVGQYKSHWYLDNQVVGNWKRTIKINDVAISDNLFGTLNKTHDRALEAAAKKYKSFLW